MGTHLRTPLAVATQRREQQSSSFAQTSSTRRVQALPSLLVHARFTAHRATPSVPETQLAEQQSAAAPHSSPLARQPASAAHRRSPFDVSHTWPQQSVSAPQLSPAGRHVGAAAHTPDAHEPLQQLIPTRHAVPETEHAPPSAEASTSAASNEAPSGPSRIVSDTASQPVSARAAIRR
jgi:hypothetical protein